MNRLRLLFDRQFIRYALKRFSAAWSRLVSDYRRAQNSSDGLAYRSDVFVTDYRYLKRDPSSIVSSGVRIVTPTGPCNKETGVHLGRSSYLGPNVFIEIDRGNVVRIGEETSVNPNTVLIGDVWIGNHSMVAPDVYISSGNHFATYRPHWLIRDQDAVWETDESVRREANSPVIIEDDCWIGKGVLIRNGIYVGRGAVIGANSVVTKDVPPYSIQAGLPNREISKRLAFEPPDRIEATEEYHWPYFYSGFKMRQKDRQGLFKHRVLGVREGPFRVVLRGGPFTRLQVKGKGFGDGLSAAYRIECNGLHLGRLECNATEFDYSLSIDLEVWKATEKSSLPSILRGYNVLSFVPEATSDGAPLVGFASFEIS